MANLTVGKKKYADVQEDILALNARAEALRARLVELVEDYKLVVNGNYILFCITENADQAVEIFDDYTK